MVVGAAEFWDGTGATAGDQVRIDAQVEADLGGYRFAENDVYTAGQMRGQWVDFLRGRYATGQVPLRTTDDQVGMWLGQIDAAVGQFATCPELCVSAGLAVDDLLRFDQVSPFGQEGPGSASRSLVTGVDAPVRLMAEAFPDCPVRDAVGWTLVAERAGRYDPSVLAREWVDLARFDGWVYAAAGFTPDEAAAAVADGTLDQDRVRVLAALRGVTLPV